MLKFVYCFKEKERLESDDHAKCEKIDEREDLGRKKLCLR